MALNLMGGACINEDVLAYGYMDLFKRDKARLDAQENSMNMLLRANFALLGHALNGNNVEQMQSAFNDIQEYLFNR